jgi:hypothetical protein
MTSFDKIVAADLAALATDSHHGTGTFDSFVPAPRAVPVPRPKDPIRVRVNRIAALAAGGTLLACAAGVASTTIREPFFMAHHVVNEAPLFENAWFLGFASVALVATAFLLAHRIAARVLDGSREWRTRARRLGDVAFGVTAVVWLVGWVVVMLDGNRAWSLQFWSRGIDIWRGHMFDVRDNWCVVLAGGLACSLTARAIAVLIARSSAKRSSDALALFAKLAGMIALVMIFAMPEFGRNGAAGVAWGPYFHRSATQRMFGDIHEAMFHVREGWASWSREWFYSEQIRILVAAVIVIAGVAALTSLCLVERYTKRCSRVLRVLEHPAVMALAIVVAFVSLALEAGAAAHDDFSFTICQVAAAALVILAVSTSLRSRRASLET